MKTKTNSTTAKPAPERLTDNVAAGKGINMNAAEAACLHDAIEQSKAVIAGLQQQIASLQHCPTLVNCPKCDDWVTPWDDELYACPTCMPERTTAATRPARWVPSLFEKRQTEAESPFELSNPAAIVPATVYRRIIPTRP